MILLIVDDEPDVLDGILTGVDMEKLGFTQVYTARSGEEAMQIMLQTPVDVLITDIEMSDMNGLSLLEWARQNQKSVVTIFCTAYSEFNYAKKAVELHAFDYYLKPIRYEELTSKLEAAVEEVRAKYMENNMADGDIQRQNRYYFWSNVFHKIDSKWDCSHKECWLLTQAEKRMLPYKREDYFTLLVVDLYQEDKLRDWTPALIDTAFENVLSELFTIPNTTIEAIISVHPGSYQMVIYQQNSQSIDRTRVQDSCRAFIDFCNRHMGISADCYYCTDVRTCFFEDMIRKANEIFRDDVASQNQVYDIFPYQKKGADYVNLGFSERIGTLLQLRRWEEIQTLFGDKLDVFVRAGTLTRSGLQAAQLDFIQAINSFLQANGIAAHTLFFNEDYHDLYESAKDAVDATKKFVDYVLKKTKAAVSSKEVSKENDGASAVETVQKYIEEHLSEDLNRLVLAKTVFLNPDYLAKLFKEKTGQSLAAYVKVRRIERAKALLTETDIPIGSVAQQIGYDNLSYFSSVFHDKVGLQPGEYRRQSKKE